MKTENTIGLVMLLGAIVFNLWLYRLEPTATTDPNDNTFQFALVDRTNQIWDFAGKKCSSSFGHWDLRFVICQISYLVDHWVPNWAEGYNLPYYYSHLPQIAIVTSYRMVSSVMHQVSSMLQQCSNGAMKQCVPSLFQYYHGIIYLLLSFFPLPVFIALRVVGMPWLTAGIGALLATHISTDGLYGLDPPSFLWRGYGLSSQLFAMFFLPLAIAYGYKYFSSQENNESRIMNDGKNKTTSLLPLFFIRNSYFWPSVFFLIATASGHLGIGMIALLSLIPLALAEPLFKLLNCQIAKLSNDTSASLLEQFNNLAIQQLWRNIEKLFLLGITVAFFLSYWIVPIVIHDNFHNISFWDPVWKFNSYGWKEVMKNLLNGDLFDFGRFPVFTFLVFVGFFVALWQNSAGSSDNFEPSAEGARPADSAGRDRRTREIGRATWAPLALLFGFWLVLYFGRTTWGGLIDLIPGMKEFHVSRFIVGVHLAGLFLAPIGLSWFVSRITYHVSRFKLLSTTLFHLLQQWNHKTTKPSSMVSWSHGLMVATALLIVLPLIYRQTIKYNELNNTLIVQANKNYETVKSDVDELFATVRELTKEKPGRVFAGRGGGWGKDFRVAETPYYMLLSTYGIPTVLWLPQTWSPNSDTEQYFSEDVARDYNLYNIRYAVAPPDQSPQPFWKLTKETPSWKLYVVASPTSDGEELHTSEVYGYFATGVRPAIVATDKLSYVNVVRLWIQSDNHEKGLYPELTFAKDFPRTSGLPNFKMIDEATFKVPDGSVHNLFTEPPLYLPPGVNSKEEFSNVTIQQFSNTRLLGPQEVDTDMVFKTKIEVGKNCTECLVILKQTSHPNWRAKVNGKPTPTITVFPFYVAVPISEEGIHEIEFYYEPSRLKVFLLALSLIVFIFLVVMGVKRSYWNRLRATR